MASKAQAHDPVEETVERLAQAAKVVQEATQHIIDFSQDSAHKTEEIIEEKVESAQDSLKSGVKKTSSLIKKYPLESALVFFGAGFLVGALLKKRG